MHKFKVKDYVSHPELHLRGIVVEIGDDYVDVSWVGHQDIMRCIPKEILFSLQSVAQQPHYTQWKIQPITFITANALNFCQGNVIKYVMRYKAKNGLEDLKKAKVYIDYLIQELETGEVKP